jgi:predicted nucleic acid-binding OB-fold protein
MRDLGNPYADPRIVPEERGLEPGPTPFTLEDRIREEQSKLGIGSDKMRDIKENYLLEAGNQGIMSVPRSDIDPQFQDMVMRTTGGLQDPVTTKLNEQKDKIEAIQKSDAYEFLSDAQKEQLQKDLNKIIQDLNLKQIASSVASSIDT